MIVSTIQMKNTVVSKVYLNFISNLNSSFAFQNFVITLDICLKPNWFYCANSTFETCISPELVCNGLQNCPSGEDEMNCNDIKPPKKYSGDCTHVEFKCQRDQICIPLSKKCNGHRDCSDGADEQEPCPLSAAICTGFLCNSKQCLRDKKLKCDGKFDCTDGSDENNCSKYISLYNYLISYIIACFTIILCSRTLSSIDEKVSL